MRVGVGKHPTQFPTSREREREGEGKGEGEGKRKGKGKGKGKGEGEGKGEGKGEGEIFRELASSDGLSYDRCVCGKRGLFIWQKRPIYMAKETHLYGKRDPFIWQKRSSAR